MMKTLNWYRKMLNRPIKWTTELCELGDKEYRLLEPVMVLIEEYHHDDVVIARLPELEVLGEGVTDTEAISNLKLAILDLYDELTETDPHLLGDLPQAWLRILTKTIAKG